MSKKAANLFLVLVLIGVLAIHCRKTSDVNRVVSRSLVARVDYASWIHQSFEVSPDRKHVAYVVKAGDKKLVVVDREKGKKYRDIKWHTIVFSPDSKRVAYEAQEKKKSFVVVDREEGKRYELIGLRSLVFSPDGKHYAYVAGDGEKQFVVVDGEEGKRYDAILPLWEQNIVFDSGDTFHYLAARGNEIYLVEERIKGKKK